MHANGTKQAGTQLMNFGSRAGSSFVIPAAARWVDQVFDPAVYEADSVQGALLLQVPWARRMGRPALNAFGEEVTRAPFERFTTPAKPDALVQLLASKSAWVPQPNLDSMIVGDRKRGPDYFRPMTPDEYYQFIAESGPAIRDALSTRMDEIAELEPEQAQALVRKIANEEHAKVREQFQ